MDDAELYLLLGRNVAAHRADKELKQAQVAERVGLTRASLANIESGRQRVMLHHIYGLVDALGLDSITDLLPARWPEKSADAADAGNRGTMMFASDSLSDVEKAQVKMLIDKAMMSKTTSRRR